jgi:hypothetical protein
VPRLPAPEETESCSVPADERIQLHNRDSACPGKESAQYHQGEFRRGSWTPPTGLALQVESQLPPEKQILSDHPSSGTKKHSAQVAPNGERHGEGPNHSALLPGQRGCRSISNTLLQHPPSHVSNCSGAQLRSQSRRLHVASTSAPSAKQTARPRPRQSRPPWQTAWLISSCRPFPVLC